MRLIVIRHGETEWNTSKKIQGVTDVELSRNGVLQACRLAARIQRFPVCTVYTSPLKRAAQTAQSIAEAFNLSPVTDDNLKEMCFGAWEGKTFEELGVDFKAELEVWNASPQDCVIPGAESFMQVSLRCQEFICRVKSEVPQNGVAVAVTHSLPAKLLMANGIGLPLQNVHSLRMDNASLTIMDYYPDRAVLKLFNDTAHIYE